MKGSIRAFVGLLVVFGAAGGLDTATDSDLYVSTLLAIAGLAIMYSGVRAMNSKEFN
jgi:hypothetical protein